MNQFSLFLVRALAVFLLIPLLLTVSFANDNKTQLLVQNKLRVLDFYIQRPNTLKQKNNTSNVAIKIQHKASLAKTQIQTLFDKQQYAEALAIADKALQDINKTNQILTKNKAKKQKEINHYNNVTKTINSFVKTFNKELNEAPENKLSKQHINKALKKASELVANNRYPQAIQVLEIVYQQLKEFIYQRRDNKTLVYSLNFASDKEEYEYEQKRYKSFKLLLEMTEKQQHSLSSKTRKSVRQLAIKSNALKQEAQQMASKNKYRDAINNLEESEKLLIRALRTMGLMIP
jgi:hypothetical protein